MIWKKKNQKSIKESLASNVANATQDLEEENNN